MNYKNVEKLLADTAARITQNGVEWMKYLDTASRVYKYGFDDQMLIYAQMPEATAVATCDIWNKSMHCWINRGAKGISLIDSSRQGKLRYVYDVSNVHETINGHKPVLWQLADEHKPLIASSLCDRYEADTARSFEESMLSIAIKLTDDYYSEAADNMLKAVSGSNFENRKISSVKLDFFLTLYASVGYTVLKRCGADVQNYMEEFDFGHISDFNTYATLSALGNCVSDLSRQVLVDIGRIIRTYKLKSIAGDNKKEYNVSHKENIIGVGGMTHGEERARTDSGGGNGNRVRMAGGLSDTVPVSGGRTGSGAYVVRREAPGVPEGTSETYIHGSDTERKAVESSGRDTGAGGGNAGSAGEADGKGGERDRETESRRPDALGTEDEHDNYDSKRNSDDRDYIQLTLFPGTGEAPGHVKNRTEEAEQLSDSGKITVAIESTEDYADMENGFYSRTLPSGKQGIWYRLVTIDKEGVLVPYPTKYKLYASETDIQDYIDRHSSELIVISYDKIIDMCVNKRAVHPETAEHPKYGINSISVSIRYSEHPVFHDSEGTEVFRSLSFALADKLLETLDQKQHTEREYKENAGWYFKTSFVINSVINGEEFNYEGRYDIGDGEGSLVDHIRSYYEYCSSPDCVLAAEWKQQGDDYYEEQMAGVYRAREVFIPFLEQNTRLTQEDEQQFEEIMQAAEKRLSETEAVKEQPAGPGIHNGNFRLEEYTAGDGSAKQKYKANITAIKTLQKVESENRSATEEERRLLSKYVGWGGLADVFDETKARWREEYTELKEILPDSEYAAARESVLNAHYTDPVIIRGIYSALEHMGFSKGRILEPAMGIGNFFGALPESMKKSRLYGVELDSVTGRIARLLYPDAAISISGFENTNYEDNFFDVAVGNVPFGAYKVNDRRYNKYNFLIHDYFIAKSLDKVRPGGVVAFITSKGTMDKQNTEVRRYLAQKAQLLGAVRLPNTAFKANAGTEVTSDILFLQKRESFSAEIPEWVYTDTNEDGIMMNRYFCNNPHMIIGRMAEVSGPYGPETTCLPNPERRFAPQLNEALSYITGNLDNMELEDGVMQEEVLPADAGADVRNYSYILADDRLYFKEDSTLNPVTVSDTAERRIRGMIEIRDVTRQLISMQLNESSDEEIAAKQLGLNILYDKFVEANGRLNSNGNRRAFGKDSSYCLLCSLEKFDDNGEFEAKADMFYRRTIKKAEVVTHADTASEALAISLGEKAKADIPYMSKLTGRTEADIISELQGIIYRNPLTDIWETADEYLSGNVRDKLAVAKEYAVNNAEFLVNVKGLEQVQPEELGASDIEVRLGATWVDAKYINDFMYETFDTASYLRKYGTIKVRYENVTGEWNILGKNSEYGNTLVTSTYGTQRAGAYKLLEDALNLRDSRVYDVTIEDGKEKRTLNKKETMLAIQKQEEIKEAFREWVFRDPERRQALCDKYNELFNYSRPREYDGSHLVFPGMSPDITLKPHQKNAVARILYGGNTLLAHPVGAGKTYEMAAAAMECKRLGLSQKSLFVVPNHLTLQWASEFLRLYPGANILAATKKDFEPENRKKFCSRIATGEYDAVIIGHSQFEKIPLSPERQAGMIEEQINEIESAIEQVKRDRGENYTIKQMEKSKKALKVRLEKLNASEKKDNVVTFEELGVDRLFVDESHLYKNLYLYTKMRNVAGISQTEAQKSSDMYAKCRYLDAITGGKGVTFATGTPISNSMTELYTNMRYLQHDTLDRLGLGNFDAWASTFGETQTAIELSPEGTGYRPKTRFAKFFNLPELINIFKESADILTADVLELPVPKAEYENVVLKPSELQKELVKGLAERAEEVRAGAVEAHIDNMLKITTDGRKLALDTRIIDESYPDIADSKVAACADRAFEIWEETKDSRASQLIFCDLSTPKGDGSFNIYDDLRSKLVAYGVPQEEIAFIHEANTDIKKAELFARVRSGQVRFLIGSTSKMGAGTNVQNKLIALHHLDVPWRPSDIEQREGRAIRQGNENASVKIFRYVTEETFDSYSWQVIENKQRFISQIMTSKSPARNCDDIDEVSLSYAEVKALASGNPLIKEKMDLDVQVSRLRLLKANYTTQKYRLEDDLLKTYPKQIAQINEIIEGYAADIKLYEEHRAGKDGEFRLKLGDKYYDDKKEAGSAIIALCRKMQNNTVIGEYMGFMLMPSHEAISFKHVLKLKGAITHTVELGADGLGCITRIDNMLNKLTDRLTENAERLENIKLQMETAKEEVKRPFLKEDELKLKLARLQELNAILNVNEKDKEILAQEISETDSPEIEPETLKQPQADRHRCM